VNSLSPFSDTVLNTISLTEEKTASASARSSAPLICATPSPVSV
jgi:hypothetical protein